MTSNAADLGNPDAPAPETSNPPGSSADLSNQRPLLEVVDLKKHYPIQKGFLRRVVGHVRAVDGVSFTVHEGETLALVGESGCGKSTVARTVLRATDPTEGQILYHRNRVGPDGATEPGSSDRSTSGRFGNGRHSTGRSNKSGDNSGGDVVDVARLRGAGLKAVRTDLQMIFQDPYASLNPRQRIRDIIGEPLFVNELAKGKELTERVTELMEAVGLRPEYAIRYPHAFSGGQRQRIGIARALALRPRLIICDEPVSALDMSIQAQILNLLKDLQSQFGLTYLFISHDLGVVQHVSDRVAVMYVGKIVEVAPAGELFKQPRHPYTEALLSASPKPHPKYRGQMKVIPGEVPDASQPLTGCYFRTRCPYAQQICTEQEPPLRPVGGTGQTSACHFADELNLAGV